VKLRVLRGMWTVGFVGEEKLRVRTGSELASRERPKERTRGGSPHGHRWDRCEHGDVVCGRRGGGRAKFGGEGQELTDDV